MSVARALDEYPGKRPKSGQRAAATRGRACRETQGV